MSNSGVEFLHRLMRCEYKKQIRTIFNIYLLKLKVTPIEDTIVTPKFYEEKIVC